VCTLSIFFKINFDSSGFYAVSNIGNKHHIGHKQQNCLQALDKDLNDKDMNLIKDMGHGKAHPGMIQTSIFNKTGHIVSKSAICHTANYNKQNIMNDYDYDKFFN